MIWSRTTLALLTCVMAIAGGQLLFKHAANLGRASGSLISLKFLLVLGVAVSLYGGATLLWVWALQFTQLSRTYPLMALSFVIVPVGSWYFFGKPITIGYGIGVLMLLGGLIVIGQSMNS